MPPPHHFVPLSGAGVADEELLNLKETELTLGPPGSRSPDLKNTTTGLKLGFPAAGANKGSVSGVKRSFYDAREGGRKWAFAAGAGGSEAAGKAVVNSGGNRHVMTQDGKGPSVGWPPVHKNRQDTIDSVKTRATKLSEIEDDVDEKQGMGCLYVKVSMDGAPYLRKVDLKIYNSYEELSSGLEKMFSCFTSGQCGSPGIPACDGLSETLLMDLLIGSEYVLTYEDKDGDSMLVGDVPWEMFMDSCRRLRIMKGSDAIGLAPRAMEKCKKQT